MQKLNFRIVIYILFWNTSIGIYAAPMEDSLRLAREFYHNQDYTNALRYYEQYIKNGNNYTTFASIVIEASLAIKGIQSQITFIKNYLDKAPRLDDRMLLHKHLAFLYEAVFDYTNAIIQYSLAYQSSRPPDFFLYLRVAKLSFELGEYERALYIARNVSQQINRQEVRLYNEVLIVMIRSLLMLPDSWENFEKIMQNEKLFIDDHAYANLLYLIYFAYNRNQQFTRSQEFKTSLIRRYPDSPEAMELQGKIKRSITPSLLWW